MAAPTQQYPPWLTPIPETIFGPGGVPITTSTTILYLPLTYYGPSIPLGSEWIYGGLTPPASTVVIPTTVIPSSSTPTATPSATATASITSASSTSLSASSSSTASSSATPTKHTALSHNQLIGIIIGAVIGALVIILALFVCFLLIKNRRRERRAATRRNVLSIDQEYVVVDDSHVPGDGSPRHSGEERDSLLQAHNGTPTPIMEPRYQRTGERSMSPAQPAAGPSAQPMQQIPVEMGARPRAPRVPILPPDTHSSLNSGTSNSSTEMSSLGSLVPNSRLSTLSPLFEEQREIRRAVLASHLRGPILSPQAQRRVGELSRPESSGRDSGKDSGKDSGEDNSGLSSLPPPPRSMDPLPGGSGGQPHVRTAFVPYVQRNIKPHDSYGSFNRSSSQTDPEDAALLTARRVKPLDWGVRASSPYYLPPSADRPNASSSASGGIISSISSRISWFKNLDALPGSLNRRSGAQKSSSSSDKDPEASKALLSPIASESSEPQSPLHDQVESSQSNVRPRPFLGAGLLSDGTRPVSGVSGRSGASSGARTAYYDAMSSLPNSPSIAPLPRAITPAPGSLASQQSRESNNWRLPSPLALGMSSSSLHVNSEQAQQEAWQALAEFGGRSNEAFLAYNEDDTITREHSGSTADVDALDMPVPPGLPNFRNTFGVVPMTAFASTSTAFSNSNTMNSTSAPTLFTHREGTLSTSTSESSLNEASNETARAESSTLGGGSKQDYGSGKTVSNMVHVPPVGPNAFAVKEVKSWSDGSAGYNSIAGTIPSYDDEATAPSRETSRTNMTGTTLATTGENSTNTAISIDLLEDEPPSPGEGWRSLAGVVGEGSASGAWDGVNRRFTMGAPMPDRYVRQEVLAELGSMRPHLSPVSSNRSTGRDISGSSGSRSSARYSLAHSGSLSSFEGRRRYISSLRYRAYSGASNSGGSVSPTLSAFGVRIPNQASDDGTPMLRNRTPLSEQQAGSPYYTPPESMSGRSTNGALDMPGTFRSAMTAETPLMEEEEDVVDAARAAMNSGYDREFGMRSPRLQTSESEASLGLSSAPWAAGLDHSWTPL